MLSPVASGTDTCTLQGTHPGHPETKIIVFVQPDVLVIESANKKRRDPK